MDSALICGWCGWSSWQLTKPSKVKQNNLLSWQQLPGSLPNSHPAADDAYGQSKQSICQLDLTGSLISELDVGVYWKSKYWPVSSTSHMMPCVWYLLWNWTVEYYAGCLLDATLIKFRCSSCIHNYRYVFNQCYSSKTIWSYCADISDKPAVHV